MGGGALFAAKPGYAQPLGALGLNYSVVLSAWKYHATAPGLILSSGIVPVDDATDYSSPQRVMEALVQTDWHKSVKVMLVRVVSK